MKKGFVYNRGFFLIDKKDRRAGDFKKFKKKHGFSPDELWSLDGTISEFVLPRLKYFRKHLAGHPSDISEEEWLQILDTIIWSMEHTKDCGVPSFKFRRAALKLKPDIKDDDIDKMFSDRLAMGFKNFGEWFQELWQ